MTALRPWQTDSDAFQRLATATRAVKHLGDEHQEAVTEGLRLAFTRVYRAVAFDIDGTLTVPGGIEIDPDMASIVGDLLRRGVPVYLITGRGRGGARSAARQVASKAGLLSADGALAFPYVRRLRCVTHNGAYLLSSDEGGAFLRSEEQLYQASDDIARWHKEIAQLLSKLGTLPADAYGMLPEPEPGSVRIEFRSPALRDLARGAIQEWIETQSVPGLHITVGTYGVLSMLDVGVPDKGDASNACAERLGVDSEQVLRIGDQGDEGGNDYNFLAVVAGFSVDRVSSEAGICHPVLDDAHVQLRGAAATRQLLEQVYLFAPLSVAPDQSTVRARLLSFERSAISLARTETIDIERLLTVRTRQLLAHDPEGRDAPMRVDDLFDQRSGGIRLASWELPEACGHAGIQEAFDFNLLDRCSDAAHGPRRCMYTDNSVLLRGPEYYASLSGNRNAGRLLEYMSQAQLFISEARDAVQRMMDRPDDPSLVEVKALLGIMDNVRDIGLQLLNISLLLWEKPGCPSVSDQSLTMRIAQVALAHTGAHVSFLLDAHKPWRSSLSGYHKLLADVLDLLDILEEDLPGAVADRTAQCPDWGVRWMDTNEFFKWREADHIVQNIVAVQTGLRRLIEPPSRDERPLGIGLAYGGLELPLIAHFLGERMGRPVVPAVLRVSVYGDRLTGERVRKGDPNYIADIVKTQGPVILLDDATDPAGLADRRVILFDDNCTTGVTLQLARDLLVYQGADVIGAVIVRFPSSNRAVHMGLAAHGFLDLDLTFGFVWGLVGSSPYTRLIVPGPDQHTLYEDENGVFDKGKQRVRYLLRKNDPSAFPDGVTPTPRRVGSVQAGAL